MVLVTEIDIPAYKQARPLRLKTLPATAGFIDNRADLSPFKRWPVPWPGRRTLRGPYQQSLILRAGSGPAVQTYGRGCYMGRLITFMPLHAHFYREVCL